MQCKSECLIFIDCVIHVVMNIDCTNYRFNSFDQNKAVLVMGDNGGGVYTMEFDSATTCLFGVMLYSIKQGEVGRYEEGGAHFACLPPDWRILRAQRKLSGLHFTSCKATS